MTRPRTILQPGDEILAEIADLLIEQNRLLGDIRDRLPKPVRVQQKLVLTPRSPRSTRGEGEGGPVPAAEPARPSTPAEAKPVDEPAKPTPPGGARPVSEPAPKRPPQDEAVSVPPPPPRSGKGSGIEAWRSFANIAKVAVPDGASRDDIIAACQKAGVIDCQ